MKIIHVRRVINARAYALANLAASFSVLDEEVRHIMIIGRILLTPLFEMLLEHESEGAGGVETATEPIKADKSHS